MNILSTKVGSSILPAVMRTLLTWEHMESGVRYNPTTRTNIQNPYPLYDRLREKDPVHRLRLTNGWLLTRYEDVDRVMRADRSFSRDDPQEFAFSRGPEYKSMLRMDPPDHTRLRSLVSKAFTPKAVADLGPTIQKIVDDHLDGVAGRDQFDLLRELADLVPLHAVATMVGLPKEDVRQYGQWAREGVNAFIPFLLETEKRRIRRASEEAFQYVERQIESRQREPQNDMITALIDAEENGDRLSRPELITTVGLLLVAGYDMTRNLIGNGMFALLRNPEQLEILRRNPDLLDSAIHEMLRYDSPAQLGIRFPPEDVEIQGRRIRAGQRVACCLGAANRDPEVFADPHVLDISRDARSHIAFGRGIHHCLGAPLIMLLARIVFTTLLDRFPRIALACEPTYRHRQIVQRGLEELWIDVSR